MPTYVVFYAKSSKLIPIVSQINYLIGSTISVLLIADFPLNGMTKSCMKVFTSVLKDCNSCYTGASALLLYLFADFPLNGMNKSCVKVFTSVLKDCNSATLEHLLYFCISSMVSNSQGFSTYGYKIFLQILARNYPDMVVSKLSQVQ